MKLVTLEIINEQANTTNLDINPDNVVFVSEVDLPTNIVGMDGEPKFDKGTAIALSNGMMMQSKYTVQEVKEKLCL